jgi:PAS domain S-box-containing protein
MLDGSWTRAPDRTTAGGDDWMSLAASTGLAAAVGIGYFLAVRLSLALLRTPDGVAAFWPAAGVAAGALVALGPSARMPVAVGVAIGSILSLIGDRGLPATVVFTICGAGQALLISWLIERHHGPGFSLDTLPRVLRFFLATAIAMALGGAVGAAGFAFFVPSETTYLTTWLHWFACGFVGVVTVAPLMIEVARTLEDPPDLAELVEGGFILAILAFAGVLGFGWPTDHWFTILPLAMLLPLLVWPAARCPTVFAAAAVFVLALIVVCTTTFGVGRLGDASVLFPDRVLVAQSALMAVSACALIVSALFAERRSREALLSSSNERLRAQQESFRQLLGALPAAIYTTDRTGRLTYCNQAAADLWGTRPELGKQKWSDIWRLYYPDGTPVPLDDRPTSVVLSGGQAVRGPEALLERPDGTRVPIMPCPAPLIDARGTVVGVVNMQVDLTERKRTEARLAEREAQLTLFVEHAPAAIAMFDREMRYLAVSRRFVADYRLPPDAHLVGRSHYEMFPETPQRWRDMHARVLAGEEFSNEEDRFTRRDGRTDWVRWSMTPWRSGDGRIGGAVLFAEVRTEQVEAQRALSDSEARFRATFENAAVGVALVGSDGSILRANSSFARMLGYSVEELTTRTFQDLTYPDDLAANLSVLNKTLVGEAQSYCIEKRYVRKDGSVLWANLTVGCVRKSDNSVDYFISVIQDITDRKQAEARLAERNAQLDLAHRAARVGSYAYDFTAKTMRISRASAAVHDPSPSVMDIAADQWGQRVHRDDMERVRAEHIRALKERRRELVCEFRYVRPGGEVRWIEARSLVTYADNGRAERMMGVYIDVTERRKSEDQKSLLIAELDHRVKNVLACVAAVAQQSRECSRSPDEFLDVLNGRIDSLANAHALLSRRRWEGVGLGELVRSELARCVSDGRHLIEGPDIVLAAEATQPLAMVLHELTTNATKYGALSSRNGRVSVCWGRRSGRNSHDHLALEWRETGGPPIVVPGPSGYGSSVIRDLIPYELGGSVDYVLAPEGVSCRVEIPARWLRDGRRQRGSRAKSARSPHSTANTFASSEIS